MQRLENVIFNIPYRMALYFLAGSCGFSFNPQKKKEVPAKDNLADIFAAKIYSTGEIICTNITSRILLASATRKHDVMHCDKVTRIIG